MSVSVEVRRNDFPRIASRFVPEVDAITTLHVFKVHETADPNTPRASGDLANNVVVTPMSGGQGGQVHWLMGYSGYVNGGTVHMAAQPFATNAADQVFPQWQQAMSQIEGRL